VSEYFIFYRPRDIVSGDFYWIKQAFGRTYIIAADCTGHGVPGAFMSMLGVAFLNEIVSKRECDSSDIVLNELRRKVTTTLSQSEIGAGAADGMDISLIIIDNETKNMQFSGAYNYLVYIREGELNVMKADRMPIGKYHLKEKLFSKQEMQLLPGDILYLFTDGYRDQFGGVRNSKYGSKGFKKLLLDIHEKPMNHQHAILEEELSEWKGDKEQIDDILVLGIKM
jgi:serine phosphatase RsbU (regulator of sigma subunit)